MILLVLHIPQLLRILIVAITWASQSQESLALFWKVHYVHLDLQWCYRGSVGHTFRQLLHLHKGNACSGDHTQRITITWLVIHNELVISHHYDTYFELSEIVSEYDLFMSCNDAFPCNYWPHIYNIIVCLDLYWELEHNNYVVYIRFYRHPSCNMFMSMAVIR